MKFPPQASGVLKNINQEGFEEYAEWSLSK